MLKFRNSLFLLSLLCMLNISAQTNIVGGEVSGKWEFNASPYIIQGDISVHGELVIEPGVEILFEDNVRIEIYGKLTAEGNIANKIKFKNKKNTWGGLHFINSNEPSILKNFEISGVRNLKGYGGALSINNSKNTIVSHGTIFNNSSEYRAGGISLLNLNNFTLSNILLYKNSLFGEVDRASIRWGTAIFIENSAINLINITATKNTFLNSATGTGSTIYWSNRSEVSFINCLIQGNDSASIERSNNNDQLVISNSNIKGLEKLNGLNPVGLIVGEGNFDAMPNFEDFDNDNFNLSWPSYPDKSTKPKEIDGGIPSIHDKDGSISDIGALMFDQSGVYFPPSSWFSAEDTKIQSGTRVQFLNNSQKGSDNIVSYSWDFGDGNTSNEFAPLHAYSKNGKFDVTLTVMDSKGFKSIKTLKKFIISGTLIPAGNISGEWNKLSSPYIINGNIIVPKNELLEVKPGAEILFTGYFGIRVEGNLKSIGTEDERITFTSLDTLNFWDRNNHIDYSTFKTEVNGWNGIDFTDNNVNSTIRYTNISYFRNFNPICSDGASSYYGGAIRLNNNNGFIFEKCIFKNNNAKGYQWGSSQCHTGACIKAYYSDIIVRDCIFDNNEADHAVAIYIWKSKNAIIENNTFRNNKSWGMLTLRANNNFYVTGDDQLLIRNNLMENNDAGGIEVIAIEGNVLIKSNVIDHNKGHGIYTVLSSPKIISNKITNNSARDGGGILTGPAFGIPEIINNFISGNEITYYWGQGSGILCETNTYIINNTITNNISSGAGGEGIFGDNCTYTAKNNIVYNNPKGSFGQNDGAGVYKHAIKENNFEGNPLFIDGNLPKIGKNSPCVDKGTLDLPISLPNFDYFGNERINGKNSKIDIGAVEVIDVDFDNDGVENNIDKCPDTPKNQKVDLKGCLSLPYNNFTIQTIGETCLGKKNAKIIIKATEAIDYVATFAGTDYNFTTDLTIENLDPGDYELCIKVPTDSYKQCYNLSIAKGGTLTGKTSGVLSKSVVIEIIEGTAPFEVILNGSTKFTTDQSTFNVDVNQGDLIVVKSSIACEGIYSKTISELPNGIFTYPNPTKGLFEITVPTTKKEIYVELYTINSVLITKGIYTVLNQKIQLSLENQSYGLYIVKTYSDTPVSLIIIKE